MGIHFKQELLCFGLPDRVGIRSFNIMVSFTALAMSLVKMELFRIGAPSL